MAKFTIDEAQKKSESIPIRNLPIGVYAKITRRDTNLVQIGDVVLRLRNGAVHFKPNGKIGSWDESGLDFNHHLVEPLPAGTKLTIEV